MQNWEYTWWYPINLVKIFLLIFFLARLKYIIKNGIFILPNSGEICYNLISSKFAYFLFLDGVYYDSISSIIIYLSSLLGGVYYNFISSIIVYLSLISDRVYYDSISSQIIYLLSKLKWIVLWFNMIKNFIFIYQPQTENILI